MPYPNKEVAVFTAVIAYQTNKCHRSNDQRRPGVGQDDVN